jgi:hypothetical protein
VTHKTSCREVPSEIGNKFKRLLLNEREFDDTN